MSNSNSSRDRAIRYLTALIRRRGGSQFQMFLLTTLSTAVGVLASTLFHGAGVTSMGIRYPMSIAVAYLTFLIFLSFVVSSHRFARRRLSSNSVDDHYVDVSGIQPFPIGGGNVSSGHVSAGNGSGGVNFGGVDGDGIVIVLLILLAIGSGIFANVYVVYRAPTILAEIIVDGVLFLRLARSIDHPDRQHWVFSVIQRTILPLIVVTICFVAVGQTLENLRPGATTMYEAVRTTQAR